MNERRQTKRDWLSNAAAVNDDLKRRLDEYDARQQVELPCDVEGEKWRSQT